MLRFDNKYRKQGFFTLAGIDEAGRGPLAGPVVAAAVIMPQKYNLPHLADSKVLSARQRDILFDLVTKSAISITTAVINSEIIDSINIFNATYLAMKKCVEQLTVQPDLVLIDGPYKIPGMPGRFVQEPVIDGDALSASLACASIIAKVTRDRIMVDLDKHYPQYEFYKHKGYGTKIHKTLIKQHGLCPVHRLTFNYAEH
jgi:ribonuclease HII